MKKLLIPFFLLLVVLMNACKKDESSVKPSETPVTSLLTETDWVSKSYSSGSKFELGYIFSTTTKGKITQLSAQMSEPGVYSVSV